MPIKTKTIIKAAVVVLILLCLFPISYGLLNLIRFCLFIGFVGLAFIAYGENKRILVYAFACLALLFQPFFKIALGREVWFFVDIATLLFILAILIKNKELKL